MQQLVYYDRDRFNPVSIASVLEAILAAMGHQKHSQNVFGQDGHVHLFYLVNAWDCSRLSGSKGGLLCTHI